MQPSTRTGFSYLIALCCIGVSIVYWMIFYPGILTPDSVQQYDQAITGMYTDWHPPVMAFLISCVLRAGGNLGLITLAQFFLGFYGASRLCGGVSKSLGASNSYAARVSFVSTLIFALPFTPLPIFLATLGKDTWTVLSMLWVLILLMEIQDLRYSPASFRVRLNIVLLGLVTALLILLRHNTILVYPVIAVCTLYLLKGRPWPYQAAVILPVVIYLAFVFFQYRVLDAARIHIERVVYEIDLVSMIAHDPRLRSALPYTSSQLRGELDGNFVIGDRAYIHIYINQLIDQAEYLDPRNGELLAAEYRSAVINFPGTWLTVKTIMFLDMFEPFQQRPIFQDYMQKNEHGISFWSLFSPEREIVFELASLTSRDPLARWLSFVHLPWLLLNITLVAAGLYAHQRMDATGKYLTLVLIFLIPLAYYFSYFPAVTAPDFRFMYPSTLVIQAAVLGILLNIAGRGLLTMFHKRQASG
jgi:hypothetical protein